MLLYLILLGAATVLTAGSAGFLFAQAPDRRANQLLGLLLMAAAYWSGCQVVWNFAPEAASARLWMRLSAPGWLLMGILLPHMALHAQGNVGSSRVPARERWRRVLGITIGAQYLSALVILLLVWSGSWVIGEAYRTPWGWSFQHGPGLYVIYCIMTGGVAISCAVIRRTNAPLSVGEALQHPWMWIGIALPVALICLTDVLLPGLGISVPRLGSAALAVTGFIAVWQSLHYGISVLSPSRFSHEILDCLDDGVVFVSARGGIRRANGALTRMSGYSPEELIGRPLSQIVVELVAGSPDAGDRSRRDLIRRSGDRMPVSASIAPLRDRQQNLLGAVVVVRDLRELESLRLSAMTNARLAAVGELAAGIAHEINNPVAFVGANLRVLREYWDRLAPGSDASVEEVEDLVAEGRELISDSLEGCERAAEIVRGVKSFTHAGSGKRELAELHDLIDDVVSMVRAQIDRPGIRVERAFGEVPAIECSPQELKQVFLNLLMNAIHAVGDAGVIRIETSLDAGLAVVSFIDDGDGIDPGNIDRIFDPFFTTKPVGDGTGLGLGIAHQIVTAHGGVITVHSQPEEGATFRVHLPVTADRS